MTAARTALALTAGAAIVFSGLLTGCSGSGGGARTSRTPSTTRSASSPTSGTTSGAPISVAPALLAAADVPGFQATRVTEIGTQPLPCTPHAPGLSSQFPPQTRSYVRYQSRTLHSSFQETLLGYPNSAAVADVYAAAQDGYNCSAGKVFGVNAGIAQVSAVTGDGYRGERWDYRLADGTLGTSVIGQAGRVFVTVDFVAVSGGSGEIDPDYVLRTALERVQQKAPS